MRAQELFATARVAVPLPTLWDRYGFSVKQHNKRFNTSTTPCCGESERDDAGSLFINRQNEWRWHCFRCGGGGSAVDLVAVQEGLSPIKAARKLVDEGGGADFIAARSPAPPAKPKTSALERQAAVEGVVKVLKAKRGVDPKVRSYLVDDRGLSENVIQEAYDRGMLRTLPGTPDTADVWLRLNLGEDLLSTSDLLRGKRCAAAYRPLVFLPGGGSSVEFCKIGRNAQPPKALQYGEQSYPLIWQPTGKVTKVLVVEGGVDVLSAVDLGFANNTMILGLLGVAAWRDQWIDAIQDKYPSAAWQIGFDADKAGNLAAPKLVERLKSRGIAAERLSPWGGGSDWNDTLLAARHAF